MSLKFEKIDDVLTENARDLMTDNISADIDEVKSGVMGLVAIIQQTRSYVSQGDLIKCFDTIAAINEQLDNIWEVYAELGYAYSTLLEKYQEATKKTE